MCVRMCACVPVSVCKCIAISVNVCARLMITTEYDTDYSTIIPLAFAAFVSVGSQANHHCPFPVVSVQK